ncbi:MAG: PKD domain-containing protein [Flavobacteriales bacterium]
MKNSILLVISFFTFANLQAQSPGGVSSGLKVWLKGDAGTSTTTDGAFMSYWNDQSGNGNNATQATGAAQPKYIKTALNGNPAMESNGGTRYFGLSLSSIDNHEFTVITVVKRAGSSNNQYIIGIQQSVPSPGLHIGYVTNANLRHGNYGNTLNLGVTTYNAATESPRIVMAECSSTFAKTITEIKDGTQLSASNGNILHYTQGASGALGRGWTTSGFQGYIAEVVVYDRILTAAEKRQIHTYISIKYGLSVLTTDHLYYNEPSYAGDVFGIGKDVAGQGLNQSESTSENTDDILTVKSPSDLNDGEYLVFGNDNANTNIPAYGGSNCSVTKLMNRVWKVRHTGDVGTVTLRFDMTGIPSFDSSKLMLIVDTDNDGFDDESGIEGTYAAPWFEVTGVKLVDSERFTIAEGNLNYYAIASGNATAAIWCDTPGGTPFAIATFCDKANMIIQPGITVTCDWASFGCNQFEVKAGATFNAGTTSMTVNNNYTINGTFSAGTSTVTLAGKKASVIGGSGVANMYWMNVTNAQSVTINASSGGVVAKNLIQITSGTLYTNAKLNLLSDGTTAGMIGPLTSGSLSGNITINRYHTATAQGWVNLASSIQNKTVADWNDDLITTGFAGSDYPPPYPFNNVQLYNESVAGGMNTGFTGVTNVTNAIQDRTGYFVFMNAGVMNLDADGEIYSGNQTMPVTYTNTSNPTGDGWNMLANPYPCTIDWDAASWTKTNFDNAVYVWNAALGQYATYVGGVSTNGGSRYIPHTQSFFVKANATSPALTLVEDCKATVQGTFKNSSNEAALTLRIASENYTDETTLARNANATLAYEGSADAYKLRSPLIEVPYMATINTQGDDLSVNAFALDGNETIIPLRIEAGVSGTYQLTHDGLTEFANGACVVLEDLLTGQNYPLNLHESISLDLTAGYTSLRFQLRIGGAMVSNITTAGCSGMNDGEVTVSVDSNTNCNITWMNSEGEVVATANGITADALVSELEPGIYNILIENNGLCGTTEASIIISNSDPLNATALVLPVTCPDDEDGAIALNITGGKAPYLISWSNGMSSANLENAEAGEYTAFVTDQSGCSSTFTYTVTSRSELKAGMETAEETYMLHGGIAEVNFYNTSSDAENFYWNFGDQSQTGSEQNPTHYYNKKGLYTITMTATDEDCQSTVSKNIRIVEATNNGSEFASSIIGTLTDEGVRLMFYFNESRALKITAFNMLGQQLTETIAGNYMRETITFSERRYAENAIIEVLDMNTGERAVIRLGR